MSIASGTAAFYACAACLTGSALLTVAPSQKMAVLNSLSPPSEPSAIRLGVPVLDFQPAVIGVVLRLLPPACLRPVLDAALGLCILPPSRLASFNSGFRASLIIVCVAFFLVRVIQCLADQCLGSRPCRPN